MLLTNLILATALMAGLGAGLSTVLAIASRKLRVEEDPRIDVVDAMLPHANCGACGSPGCRAFAENVVLGKSQPGLCTVSSPKGIARIAAYLGVDAGSVEKRVARLACAGGSNVARMKARYKGLNTCRAAHLVGGGGKGCVWGCLGLGDCMTVCNFDAIRMNEFDLPEVDVDKCTACGDCVTVCPRGLFSIHPVSHRLWVACKSLAMGDEVEAECEVGCTACGRCAADAPDGVIRMIDNLPVIDYSKNALCTRTPIERCPTGAIVWIDDALGPRKGEAAKIITRRTPLPVASGVTERKQVQHV